MKVRLSILALFACICAPIFSAKIENRVPPGFHPSCLNYQEKFFSSEDNKLLAIIDSDMVKIYNNNDPKLVKNIVIKNRFVTGKVSLVNVATSKFMGQPCFLFINGILIFTI